MKPVSPNFVAIGREMNECIFIHKDDLIFIDRDKLTYKVKCIAIDFQTKQFSDPVIIDMLLKFCPHTSVDSIGERSVMNDLLLYCFSDSEIIELNMKFERIRFTSQIERDDEHLH